MEDDLLVTEEVPKTRGKKSATPAEIDGEKLFRVIVEEEEGQLPYALVSVNGVPYQIKRGEEVTIPYKVLHALENSKATRYIKEKTADGAVNLVPRDYATVPYRVLR